ncbi:hypothetical protein F4677DRAFT_441888 [Hypoxylon crocopeplum]|nr:hypothetical protein F4677DRAFT_441888 [Hypoxylon crocopeplum]
MSTKSVRSRLSMVSATSCKSSRSFQSLGTYASGGSSQGGRSQSAYGQSSQAIHDWDDGWKSSQYPEPLAAHSNNHSIWGGFDYYRGAENIEPPFPEAQNGDIPRLKAVVAAAEGGNDHLIKFLISASLADPDQPPVPGRVVTFSTPMLAAIGQKNIKVVEVLLKQEGFNPTRRFMGLTYYEIAERRRGEVWVDERRMLKEAYDAYSVRHQKGAAGQEDRRSYNTIAKTFTAHKTIPIIALGAGTLSLVPKSYIFIKRGASLVRFLMLANWVQCIEKTPYIYSFKRLVQSDLSDYQSGQFPESDLVMIQNY